MTSTTAPAKSPAARTAANKQDRPAEPFRLFVKGTNWVGDALIATPALAALRATYPDAQITVMVRPWVAALYENNPDIDELWVHDDAASLVQFFKAVRRVRRGHFRIGVALPNSIRSAMLLRLGGVRQRIGYAQGFWRRRLLNRPVKPSPEVFNEHQVFFYLGILKDITERPKSSPHLKLKAGALEREEVARLLAQLGLDRGQPLVGIAPGSINSNAKRWLPERFAEVADRLHKQAGAEVILIGSPGEKDVLDKVATIARCRVHNLAGKLSLGQVVALTEKLHGLICNDSGAMHIGAALHIPTIAIFGPTEWKTTYPFSPNATIVRKEGVECAPCMLRECPIDHRCMTGVTTQMVLEAFGKMMKESAAQRRK